MRELTDEERRTLEERRANFDQFVNERMDVLNDFAERLGLNEPWRIVQNPDLFLPAIHVFMCRQIVRPDARVWILVRLGYLIGEILVGRLGGYWLLNENPETRTFLRYVVGGFSRIKNSNAVVDALAVAAEFVDQPAERHLTPLIAEVESELRNA